MITLQPFEKKDFQQLIDWIDTPAFLLQWAGPGFQFPLTFAQLNTYIKDANQENADAFIYKVVENESGKTIGHISLGNIERSNRSARIKKVLVGPESGRGQGIGVKMIQAVLTVAFEDLQLHRVSLGVFDFNTPAIACYEKAGFQKEGLLRDCRKYEENYWSLWEMSMLENEWKQRGGNE